MKVEELKGLNIDYLVTIYSVINRQQKLYRLITTNIHLMVTNYSYKNNFRKR
jgi:hypothetical protein